MVQVPPCSGIRRSISCLFWSTAPAKQCWLFRAALRNLIPRNLILEVIIEWHSFVVLNRHLRSPTPVLPPGSFILQSFAWFYVFFSTGQVLLSTLSWCSACTSVSEGILLLYLWRDVLHIHLSSAILLSPLSGYFK